MFETDLTIARRTDLSPPISGVKLMKLTIVSRDGSQADFDVEPGMTVLDTLRILGNEELMAACGGCCSCATCHIYVATSAAAAFERDEFEADLLETSEHLETGSRLACQLMLSEPMDGMTITIAPEN